MQNTQIKKRNQVKWYAIIPIMGSLLLIFLAQPSSYVFPLAYDAHTDTADWHRSFFGVIDCLLCVSIFFSLLSKKIQPVENAYWYCLFFLSLVLASISLTILDDYLISIDLLLHALRLIFLFLFGCGLVRTFGLETAINLLFAGYCLLTLSALVVLVMIFPASHRIFASAMTVASFAQISAMVALFAIHLRHFKMAAWSILFLVLTFSLTCALAFSICLLAYPPSSLDIKVSGQGAARSRLYACGGLLAFITACVTINSYLDRGFDLRFEHAMTMHGRAEIWQYGIEVLRDDPSRWFGVGFGKAPSLLKFQNFAAPGEIPHHYTQFHSIILESVLSLGFSAIPLFIAFVAFFFRAYSSKQYLEASVISLFMITQSVDFTLYRPKEEVVFALVLGILFGSLNSKIKKPIKINEKSTQLRQVPYLQ